MFLQINDLITIKMEDINSPYITGRRITITMFNKYNTHLLLIKCILSLQYFIVNLYPKIVLYAEYINKIWTNTFFVSVDI